jgi:ABC-type glycerol-3-phosphate transport system permease component
MARVRAMAGFRYLVAIVLALALLIPLLWALSGALHTNANLFAVPFAWIPSPIEWANFARAWQSGDFGRQTLNSFLIAFVISVVGVGLGQMAGYALAKFRFLGRDLIFWSIISTLTLPFPAIMVPVFIVAKDLGLVNSYLGVIVPGLITAQIVFFMRQYLIGIPQEVLDAARVDGASDLGIYWRIVMPMAWPVTAAMGILTFVGSWNNLLWPLIVIQSAQLFTLPLGLTQFSSQYFTNYVDVLALSLVSIVPVIILFLIVRRRLLDAIMVGGGSVTG